MAAEEPMVNGGTLALKESHNLGVRRQPAVKLYSQNKYLLIMKYKGKIIMGHNARAFPRSDEMMANDANNIRAFPQSDDFDKNKRLQLNYKIRMATWNLGSLTGRSQELAETLKRRNVDICCIQELRWKGSKPRELGLGYQLVYHGTSNKQNGVGVILDQKLKDRIVNVERKSDRIIAPIVLRTCAPELAPVLTRLFRQSYAFSVVPNSWKTALVHPIPKKGNRSDPSNYRPIAITSLFSKVMESIINCQLLRYLEEYQLISDRQYGFRRGRSAGDLLVYLTHRWAEAVESKGEALAVSLDIAKAFDRVWHKALLSKLPSYGLPGKLCNWITSFLADRSIKVVVDGACSDLKFVNA
ncbi:uncharacterized protein LOC125075642, partial [Vanessa atalanta]|uniref:uncharacterized protein LOC125075642 n=1 Tax=Vanessa atalanta TaxID=42275 RepID=UPI001FCE04A8